VPDNFYLQKTVQDAATYRWKLDGSLVSTLAAYTPFLPEGSTTGAHEVSLEITTLNDHLLLQHFELLSASGWGLEFHPDPYFEIRNAANQLIYTSGTVIDGDTPTGIFAQLLLRSGQQYTISVYDWDPFDPNDLMGTCTFTAAAGLQQCTEGSLSLAFDLEDAAPTYTWTKTILVNEVTLTQEPDGALVANLLYPTTQPETFFWQFNGVIIQDAPNANVLPASFTTEPGTYRVWMSFSGCSATETLTDAPEVLIEDFVIQAWPNPSNGHFQVSLAPFAGQKVTLRVNDSTGRTVFEQAEVADPVQAVDLSGLPAGLYYLSVSDGEQMAVRELQVL
jgi:hypothetical protein